MCPATSTPKLTKPSKRRRPGKNSTDLTARQRNILDYLVEYHGEHGYAPAMRDIGIFFKIKSTNAVSDHLRALERKGYIERDRQRGRGVRILKTGDGAAAPERVTFGAPTEDGDAARSAGAMGGGAAVAPFSASRPQLLDVPMLGTVAAGKPILALELAEERLSLDPALLPGAIPGTFALRVQGRSMVDAGILPADLVFVRPQPQASNGEIVVAMIDGEATVKRYYDEGERIRLQPENRDMVPIWVDKTSELRLLGRVVGVWRDLA